MVIAFHPNHLDELDLTDEHRAVVEQVRDRFALLGRANLATTVVSADYQTVLGVLGAVVTQGDECEVLIFPSSTRRAHPVTFTRNVRQELNRMRGQFSKIRALGVDSQFFTRWFTSLGFTLEGPTTRKGCEGKMAWVMSGTGGAK